MTHNGPSATPHQRTLGHGPVANAHAGRALLRAAALRTNLSIWFRSNKDGKPRMEQKTKVNSVPADPTNWSEQSQRSISFHYIREYNDITYNCWRCARSAIFSASDQRYTYEVKKAPIDQRRILCTDCRKESLCIEQDIKSCERCWSDSKSVLRSDSSFLTAWIGLLTSQEGYVPYHPNVATKNMLRNLLEQLTDHPPISVKANQP
jgi:putative zinc ribbon protein